MWAAPKAGNGQLDHHKAMAGNDLRDFVNLKLFPHLKGFKQRAAGWNTIDYKMGEIFSEIKNQWRVNKQRLVLPARSGPQPGEDQPAQRSRSEGIRRTATEERQLAQGWSVGAKSIDPTPFDLSVKNPNGKEEVTHRSPQEMLDEIAALAADSAEVLQRIRRLL